MRRLALSYVVPLYAGPDESVDELAGYLQRIAECVDEVFVVDGSAAWVVDAHRDRFGPVVRVLVPESRTLNGKVGNVVTGVFAARNEYVVLADDDVRYEPGQLGEVCALLEDAEVVRPQNYFSPCPWHARLDTARTLLNRVTGGDWPGTLGLRRSAFVRTGGYSGDVLFENLELVRTLRAFGGREHLALDVLVARRPPTSKHFRGQQVRQAYDEFARPTRLAASLIVAPAAIAALSSRRCRTLVAGAVTSICVAECGRRRAGGRNVFPISSSFLAPAWLIWRSLCSWMALFARARGGAPYRGQRIVRAASSRMELRQRVARVRSHQSVQEASSPSR